MKHELPNRVKPCSNCPFRKDSTKGWLGAERMAEILASKSFVCHKTTKEEQPRLQCAGHMIINGNNNEFVRLAGRLGIDTKLTGKELIFETKQQCINHHK